MTTKLEAVLAEEWARGLYVDVVHSDPRYGAVRASVAVLGKRALDWMVTRATCRDCYHDDCPCEYHEKEWAEIQAAAKAIG